MERNQGLFRIRRKGLFPGQRREEEARALSNEIMKAITKELKYWIRTKVIRKPPMMEPNVSKT
jgi:hypothetical protein